MGFVPISLPRSNHLYLLDPSYHMPNDPQDILSIPPLKYYNEARSARVEALVWLRVVSKEGNSVQVHHKTELQDHVSINVHTLPEKMTAIINLDIHYSNIARTKLPPIPSFLSNEDLYSTNFSIV